jgi:hypothetical protein
MMAEAMWTPTRKFLASYAIGHSGSPRWATHIWFSSQWIGWVGRPGGNVQANPPIRRRKRGIVRSTALQRRNRSPPTTRFSAWPCSATAISNDPASPAATLICFADFTAMIADFPRCLKPGGRLVIHRSNFCLCDAPASAEFATLLRPQRTTKQQRCSALTTL